MGGWFVMWRVVVVVRLQRGSLQMHKRSADALPGRMRQAEEK